MPAHQYRGWRVFMNPQFFGFCQYFAGGFGNSRRFRRPSHGISAHHRHQVRRHDDARRIFEGLLARRNHIGLLSEDIDPATGELWGNFPQTYSMVGIIVAAMRLSKGWESAR